MEISSHKKIFTSIILALTPSMVKMKVILNQVAFMKKRRTSIERSSNEPSTQIGTKNTLKDNRIKRTSKDSLSKLINTVTQKKRKSGLVDTHEKKKNSIRSTSMEELTKTSRSTRVDRLRILTTNSMTKTRCSTNSSMLNGNQRRRKCTKSTKRKKTLILTSLTEASMRDRICLQAIHSGPKQIKLTITHSKLEITKHGILLDKAQVMHFNNFLKASSVSQRNKLMRA